MIGRHRLLEDCSGDEPSRLGEELLARLGPRRPQIRLRKQQTVFHEGAPVAGVYCVVTGRIKTFKTGPEGKQYILGIVGPGDVLGLKSLFSDGSMTASAEAVEAAAVSPIEIRRARDLVCGDGALRLRVIEELTRRLRTADQDRLELAQAHVCERMARLLTDLAAEHGVAEERGVRIDLLLSRDDLASLIGTAQETAIRQLRSFHDSRLIRLQGRSITVLDRDRLAGRAYLSY